MNKRSLIMRSFTTQLIRNIPNTKNFKIAFDKTIKNLKKDFKNNIKLVKQITDYDNNNDDKKIFDDKSSI